MKKYVIISVIAIISIIAAAVAVFAALGSPTEIQVTTGISSTTATASAGTSATTSGAAGTPDNLCSQTGRGHVYEDGVCVICGAEEPTGEDYLKFKLLDDGTYCVYARYIAKAPERLMFLVLRPRKKSHSFVRFAVIC